LRVWDVHPGYLDRQRLLGEHRELHGIVSILSRGLKGYSNHPETRRWVGHGWALRQRHRLLVAEMALRGYRERTPVRLRSGAGRWPDDFVDPPGAQFALLRSKYGDASSGRIPLPRTTHELWSHHKYSVLARDQAAYRALGRRVAGLRKTAGFDELALELVEWLRTPPTPGNLKNMIEHMVGHLDGAAAEAGRYTTLAGKLNAVQRHVAVRGNSYLAVQTALTELLAWPEATGRPPSVLF